MPPRPPRCASVPAEPGESRPSPTGRYANVDTPATTTGKGSYERDWRTAAADFGLFVTWLRHAPREVSGIDGDGDVTTAPVLVGPGCEPVRGSRRVNAVLTAVRGFLVHAVTAGEAPPWVAAQLYELADDRDLPEQARGEDTRMWWRLRARHRLREPEAAVDRASDEEIVAMLGACLSARDRLIVLLMARAGLRRGELCGLRRADVHLLRDSRVLGCEIDRAHLHVLRRDNPNGAWAKSRRGRTAPLQLLLLGRCFRSRRWCSTACGHSWRARHVTGSLALPAAWSSSAAPVGW